MKGDMNFLTLSGCYRGAELHRGVSLARDGWWSLPGKNVHFIAPALIRRHPVRAASRYRSSSSGTESGDRGLTNLTFILSARFHSILVQASYPTKEASQAAPLLREICCSYDGG